MIARSWEQLNAHPRTRDGVVAVLWLMLGLAILQLGMLQVWAEFAVFRTRGTVFLVALLAMAAIATMRSTRPFLALGLGAAVAAVDLSFGGSLGVVLILSDLIYAAVKYGSDRGLRIALWATLAFGVLLIVCLLVVSPAGQTVPTVVVQLGLLVVISAAWGWAVRSERARTRTALVRTHARQTTEMRERIAHDLHDLVANQIAVAGLNIEAAKLQLATATAPAAAAGSVLPANALAASLERAKHGTDAAHRELRSLITVLTASLELDAPEQHPNDPDQLTNELNSLADVLPAHRDLRWPEGDFDRTHALLAAEPAARRGVMLRVLRELLANAAKHGAGDVTVELAAEHTRISLTNEIARGSRTAPGNGHGLRASAALLEMVGGRLESRRETDSATWIATVALPGTEPTVAEEGVR